MHGDIKLCVQLYRAYERLKKFKRCQGTGIFVERENTRILELKNELEKRGIDEKRYQSFIDKFWLDLVGQDMHDDRKMNCFHYLMYLQNQNTDALSIKHPCADKNCFECLQHKPATEDQIINYYHGRDIVSGEVIDNDEE